MFIKSRGRNFKKKKTQTNNSKKDLKKKRPSFHLEILKADCILIVIFVDSFEIIVNSKHER